MTTRTTATTPANKMKLTALAPWFGGKRTLAPEIVRQLGQHQYYFEACAGSMAVLLAKPKSEHETAIDLHGALTNLAWCIQDDAKSAKLFNRLQRVLYNDDVYAASRKWLIDMEASDQFGVSTDPLDWAFHYFLASWMGRNGVAGTARINYQIATRWTKGGGSGPLRFRNAVESIPAWCNRLRYVHILCRNILDVLPSIEDADGVAIYADPPYLPETVASNSKYLCDFGPGEHERLASELGRFRFARVVVSYYDHPRLAELYPARCADGRRGWTKIDCSRHKHLYTQNKRGSKKYEAPEVLLVNGEPFEAAGDGDEEGEDGGLFQ
jgi:DNA adenine methylase